jgi:hypothetical protein
MWFSSLKPRAPVYSREKYQAIFIGRTIDNAHQAVVFKIVKVIKNKEILRIYNRQEELKRSGWSPNQKKVEIRQKIRNLTNIFDVS